MPKRIWAIIIGLPLVLILGISTMTVTGRITEDYLAQAEEMNRAILAGDYERAKVLLSDIEESWPGHEALLHLWMPHTDTDAITQRLHGLSAGLAFEDGPLAMDSVAGLSQALSNLWRRDSLALSNIL